jgi:hypothetical protein
MTIAAAVFFPVTYFAYPWTHVALVPLWTIFVAASSLYLIGSIRESGRVVVARETAGSVLHSRRPSASSQGLAPSGAGDSGGRDVEVGKPSPALVRSQAPARREVGSSAARRD